MCVRVSEWAMRGALSASAAPRGVPAVLPPHPPFPARRTPRKGAAVFPRRRSRCVLCRYRVAAARGCGTAGRCVARRRGAGAAPGLRERQRVRSCGLCCGRRRRVDPFFCCLSLFLDRFWSGDGLCLTLVSGLNAVLSRPLGSLSLRIPFNVACFFEGPKQHACSSSEALLPLVACFRGCGLLSCLCFSQGEISQQTHLSSKKPKWQRPNNRHHTPPQPAFLTDWELDSQF